MSWKCEKCGYVNPFDNREYCAKCGIEKTPPPEVIERINRIKNILITTTQNIEGYRIRKYYLVVNAVVVLGTGLLPELNAGLADLTGSRATGYQKKIDYATQLVFQELCEKGINLSNEVNALIGLKLDFTVGEKNMMILYGTATPVTIDSD